MARSAPPGGSEELESLRAETEILATLRHAHIVRFVEAQPLLRPRAIFSYAVEGYTRVLGGVA